MVAQWCSGLHCRSQQEGFGFEPFLCEVCIFSLCLCEFSPGASVRLTGYSKLLVGVKVNVKG